MDVRKKKHEKEKPCQVGEVGKKRGGDAGGGGGRGGDDSGNCDAVMLWCAQSGLAPAVGTATSGTLRQQTVTCDTNGVLTSAGAVVDKQYKQTIPPHLPNSPQCGCSRRRRILLRQYGVLRIFPVVDDDVFASVQLYGVHSLLHPSWQYICCSRSCQSCFISLNHLFVCSKCAWISEIMDTDRPAWNWTMGYGS